MMGESTRKGEGGIHSAFRRVISLGRRGLWVGPFKTRDE
jgi:hypothetical protein